MTSLFLEQQGRGEGWVRMYRDQTGHSLWVEVGVGDRPTETALGEPCALIHLGQPLLPSQGAQVWAPVPSFPEMLGMDNPHQGWGLVLLEWPPPTPSPPLWVPPSPWESVCPPNSPTLHFLGIPYKWKHTALSVWLLPLSMFSRFTQVVACVTISL